MMGEESIPYYIMIKAKTVGDAWIEALIKIYKHGAVVGVQASASQKIERSRDATAFIVIENPLDKPRLARGDLFGYSSVYKTNYVSEVVDGVLNHKIGEFMIIDEKKVVPVPYTYNQRITAYPTCVGEYGTVNDGDTFDQLTAMLEYLVNNTETRRAQVITWVPKLDAGSSDPPCLQRIMLRVIGGRLHMHTMWRSNDLFKAFGANTYAFVEWGKKMAETVSLEFGNYVYFCNSLHIYESDWYPDTKPGKPNVEDIIITLEKQGNILAFVNFE